MNDREGEAPPAQDNALTTKASANQRGTQRRLGIKSLEKPNAAKQQDKCSGEQNYPADMVIPRSGFRVPLCAAWKTPRIVEGIISLVKYFILQFKYPTTSP